VVIFESLIEGLDCLRASRLVHDTLRDHGVVVSRNLVSFFDSSVHTNFAWDLNGLSEHLDPTALRKELFFRILSVDTSL